MGMIPSFKTMGIAGGVLALLAFLFRDNPVMQSILEFFTGAKAEAAPKPETAAAAKTQPEQAQQAPQAEQAAAALSPEQRAARLMADWKQQMESNNTPESVRLAIAMQEPELLRRFAAVKTPQELESIQMAVLSEAAKPELDRFMSAAKNQVTEAMDQTIRDVQRNNDLPAKERNEAVTALRKEKASMLKSLEAELQNMPAEKKLQLALTPEAQATILKNQSENLNAHKDAVNKNTAAIVRNNSVWAWGDSILGWTSAGLAVGGIVAAPFTGGQSLWLTAAACGTGIGQGACKMINNSGKDGSNFEWGMGAGIMALNAVPLGGIAARGVGLFATSASKTAATSTTFMEKTAAWIPGLSKATVAEGQAISAVNKAQQTFVKTVGAQVTDTAAIAEARQIMGQVTSGSAKATVLKNGTDVVGVGLTNAKEATSSVLKLGEGGKLAGQAAIEHRLYDPLVGKSTQAFRALTELGYTTTDDLVDQVIKPSQTPGSESSVDPKASSKTTLSF